MHVGCRDDEVSGRLVSLPRQAWSIDKTILCSIVYSFQKIGQTVLGSHWNGGIIIMVFDCAAPFLGLRHPSHFHPIQSLGCVDHIVPSHRVVVPPPHDVSLQRPHLPRPTDRSVLLFVLVYRAIDAEERVIFGHVLDLLSGALFSPDGYTLVTFGTLRLLGTWSDIIVTVVGGAWWLVCPALLWYRVGGHGGVIAGMFWGFHGV